MADNFGDNEFNEFMNEEEKPEQCSIVIDTLQIKINSIKDFYLDSLQYFSKIDNEDPLKNDVRDFIKKLIDLSLQTFNQIDCCLIENADEDEEDSDE